MECKSFRFYLSTRCDSIGLLEKIVTMRAHMQTSVRPFKRLLVYILLIGCCIPLLTSCGSSKTIVNGLDEKEANEIIVYLANKGIDAQKVRAADAGGGGGSKLILWDINVDSTVSTEAMSLLNQAGLPRKRGQNLLGIFQNTGLVPSEMQEQIRYQAGLAEGIASTIRKIDGVLDAEVNISFPKEDPLNPEKNKGKITASVYVKHSGVLDDPNSHLVSKIKKLVASSVTGLDYDNVTVISDRARYNESPLSGSATTSEEDKLYVSIWSIIVAKESVTRFRVIFFSLTLLILFLILALSWLGWKLWPIVSKPGAFKHLFSLHPLLLEKNQDEGTGGPAEIEQKEVEPADQSATDKDVDET